MAEVPNEHTSPAAAGRSTSHDVPLYQVRLEVFEGPLHLLLHLIEKQELDITKVSLVAVTGQYLVYIRHLQTVGADDLADFIVVAAKLLLIKSRALLPSPPTAEGVEEEDLGEELARQLREYKQLKELSQQLRQREEQGLRSFLRVAAPLQLDKQLDLSEVSLKDLMAAVREVFDAQPEAGPVNGVVPPLIVSISERIEIIETRLKAQGQFSFQGLLRESRSRLEVIVTFLALLELIKARRVQVQQEHLFGEILVLSPEEAAPEPGTD